MVDKYAFEKEKTQICSGKNTFIAQIHDEELATAPIGGISQIRGPKLGLFLIVCVR